MLEAFVIALVVTVIWQAYVNSQWRKLSENQADLIYRLMEERDGLPGFSGQDPSRK